MSDKEVLNSQPLPYSERFLESFSVFSDAGKRQIADKCRIWALNHSHPSLRSRKYDGHLPSWCSRDSNPHYFRVNLAIRVLVIQHEGQWMLEYVGVHKDFDRAIGR